MIFKYAVFFLSFLKLTLSIGQSCDLQEDFIAYFDRGESHQGTAAGLEMITPGLGKFYDEIIEAMQFAEIHTRLPEADYPEIQLDISNLSHFRCAMMAAKVDLEPEKGFSAQNVLMLLCLTYVMNEPTNRILFHFGSALRQANCCSWLTYKFCCLMICDQHSRVIRGEKKACAIPTDNSAQSISDYPMSILIDGYIHPIVSATLFVANTYLGGLQKKSYPEKTSFDSDEDAYYQVLLHKKTL